MGHWEFDPSTAQFAFNDQYYSLHGTTAEAAGGYVMSAEIFASRYVHPDDARSVGEDIQRAIETGDSNFQVQKEMRILRADGEPRDVTVWFRIEKDPQGRTTKLLGVNQDITERKQAEKTFRMHLAELEALHKVSAALRGAQTRDQALPVLLDETLNALETDAGAIWLYHPDDDELRVTVTRGWFRQFDESPMKPGEGIAGTVFASGQAHLSTEFVRDSLARPLQDGDILSGWGGACLPIRAGAITVGVLFVSVPLPRQIIPEQVILLESLTEMGGAALHRMSLHEKTVRQLDRLEALHRIDIAISAGMDLQMTLNILLEHVKTQLGADATDVLLLNPSLQVLEYAAGSGFRSQAVERTQLRIGEGQAGRAALERRIIQYPDFAASGAVFAQAELLVEEDVASYFAIPLISKGQVKGVLEIFNRSVFKPDLEWVNFLETLARQAAIAVDGAQLFENLQRSNVDLALAYDTTIEGWSRALDLRDKETEGHTQRVTEITMRLARAVGIADAELVHVRRGALLHDIGKMGVPDRILLKPGGLDEDEWVIMRKHPVFAYELLSPIAYLHSALDIPYCHHERWDGIGYPRGLKREQIPLAARVFAIVDVWDALRSDRPYRPAWPEAKVREYLKEQAGKHFDPEVVKAFLKLLDVVFPEGGSGDRPQFKDSHSALRTFKR